METFTLPQVGYDKLCAEVHKLNKRAAKINQPLISIVDVDSGIRPDPRVTREYKAMLNAGNIDQDKYDLLCTKAPHIQMYDVQIFGEAPKINGYELCGTLDHHTIPGSVIVKSVPGQVVPKQYYNIDPVCDHCGKIRSRKETFVLRKTCTGEHTVIGRQCVRDFVGYGDVTSLASYLTKVFELVSSLSDTEDDNWFGGFNFTAYCFDKRDVLLVTAAAVELRGWVARSAYGGHPTADLVYRYFVTPKFFGKYAEEMRREHEQFVKDVDNILSNHEQFVDNAIDWISNQDRESSSYIHNLCTINDQQHVPVQMFGFWCSLVSAYNKHLDREQLQKEKEVRSNEWIGNIKDRISLNVVVEKRRTMDGFRDYTHQYLFRDVDGNSILWYDSQCKAGLNEGDTASIVGTVKKHDEYNGRKQTVLTRVKIMD